MARIQALVNWNGKERAHAERLPTCYIGVLQNTEWKSIMLPREKRVPGGTKHRGRVHGGCTEYAALLLYAVGPC